MRKLGWIAVALMAASVVKGTTASAQTAPPGSAAPSSAAPAAVRAEAVQPTLSFSIPAGPLSTALAAFSEATRLHILYPASLAQGVASPGVNGTYTAQEALQRLLAKTGLGYRFTNAQTITIERETAAGATGPMSLPAVQVEGQGGQETAYGPGAGYIAHQSAAGTKTDTPIIETPQSISVVTRDQIESQNAQTVDQALRYTAGIEAESRADFTGFDFVYGRGFVLDQYLDGLKLQGVHRHLQHRADRRAARSGLGPLRPGVAGRAARHRQQDVDRRAVS